MKTVGIRSLKAKLSEYIRLVKAGEIILVTERDEVVAELRSISRQQVVRTKLDEWLESRAETGEVSLASVKRIDWSKLGLRQELKGFSSAELLDAIRAE